MRRPRRPASIRPARPSLPLLAGALAALGFAPGAHRSDAYRLLDNGAADYVVTSEQAVRWAPGVWDPGSTLSFQVAAAPEWTGILGSAARVVQAAEEAQTHWKDIATADIRWNVSDSPGAPVGTWTRDGVSSVFYHSAGSEHARGAGLWFARDPARAVWDITECDLGVPRSWVSEIGGFPREQRVFAAAQEMRSWFADCLGLGASARFPSAEGVGGYGTPWNRTTDRQTGASLLRPGSGWRESVGSISGSVVADGDSGAQVPASYVHVWAFPTSGSSPIGAFANRSGAFRIEGLPPGGYVLWAHPITGYEHRLAAAGAVTDVQDAVLALPVTVTAGRNAGGHRIPMRSGR